MIAYLKGRCQALGPDHAVIDVGGVGYLVFMAARDTAAFAPGGEIEVMVHTVVREDALQLYGFRTIAARELFLALVSVPGVGPKGALALLSELSPREIALAIHHDRARELTKARGIGKRTAELLVVRLRDRLPVELLVDGEATDGERVPSAAASPSDAVADACSALVNLGYKPLEARQALEQVQADGASDDFAALLRSSLALLRRATT